MDQANQHQEVIDHLFRSESGKMTTVLCHIFGFHNLEMVEDVVQESFLKAIQHWRFGKIPDNPSAWLMTVARNKAIDIIRKNQHHEIYAQEFQNSGDGQFVEIDQCFHENEIRDNQLRMIFACCHPALKEEDQVALTLKTVSGFSHAEIARALTSNDLTIKKRLVRARQFIRESNIRLEIPAAGEIQPRLATVHTVLYLLFNEGYNSQKVDELIRKDVCSEAMRLTQQLCEHYITSYPSSFALMSLMCFHASRFESRLENDHIITLQHQDRHLWSKELIARGCHFLNVASTGDQLSRYHIEAGIAAEHCCAESFSVTNWRRILDLYDLLIEHVPTPMAKLNRAIVLSQLGETNRAINEILAIHQVEKLLKTQYLYSAVLGDMYRRSGNVVHSIQYLQLARELSKSQAEKNLISQKLMDTGSIN